MRLADQHFAAVHCRDGAERVTSPSRTGAAARHASQISEHGRQCNFTTGGDGAGAEFAVVYDSEMFPIEMKEVGNLAMNRDGTLTLPSRFEAHHPPLI